MLEVAGKNLLRELVCVADHERVARVGPTHNAAEPVLLQHLEELLHKVGALALLHGGSHRRGQRPSCGSTSLLLLCKVLAFLCRGGAASRRHRRVCVCGHQHASYGVPGDVDLRINVCLCHGVSHWWHRSLEGCVTICICIYISV